MLPIKIIQCPGHNSIKDKILKRIDSHEDAYYIDYADDMEDNGPYTDWQVQPDGENDRYYQIFLNHAEEAIMQTVRDEWGLEKAELQNYWFQQYNKNLTHGWHYHFGCLYHYIYYVELPKGTPPTLVRLPGGFEFTPNVKEGDILIMPSILEHTSPVNKSHKRKTIIAGNIDEKAEERE